MDERLRTRGSGPQKFRRPARHGEEHRGPPHDGELSSGLRNGRRRFLPGGLERRQRVGGKGQYGEHDARQRKFRVLHRGRRLQFDTKMTPRTNEQELKEALHQGRQIYGTLVTSTSPKSIEALAGVDIDCVMIDTEHIPLGWHDLGWMCRAYRSLGIVPIVRIPRADPFDACWVLDMGAGGVVAAYIETAEEVRLLRGATKLRPLKGEKLDDILSGRTPLEGELAEYVQRRNENNILLVNIESVAAVAALDEILAVPDLDGVLIGPHDLSCSLGHPEQYDH